MLILQPGSKVIKKHLDKELVGFVVKGTKIFIGEVWYNVYWIGTAENYYEWRTPEDLKLIIDLW